MVLVCYRYHQPLTLKVFHHKQGKHGTNAWQSGKRTCSHKNLSDIAIPRTHPNLSVVFLQLASEYLHVWFRKSCGCLKCAVEGEGCIFCHQAIKSFVLYCVQTGIAIHWKKAAELLLSWICKKACLLQTIHCWIWSWTCLVCDNLFILIASVDICANRIWACPCYKPRASDHTTTWANPSNVQHKVHQ